MSSRNINRDNTASVLDRKLKKAGVGARYMASLVLYRGILISVADGVYSPSHDT